MIQFVIGAVAGIAAKKYFTKEHVEKIKETVIDISANKIKSRLDKFMYGDERPICPGHTETHVFGTRMEASEALKFLRDTIENYDYASINDYYNTFDDPNIKMTYTNERYGWFNLDDVEIEHVPNGWVIHLPEPVSIDQFTEGNPPCPDVIYFDSENDALRAENEALHELDLKGYVTYVDIARMAGIPEETVRIYSKYGWKHTTDFRTRLSAIKPDKWYITKEEPGKLYERTNRHTS